MSDYGCHFLSGFVNTSTSWAQSNSCDYLAGPLPVPERNEGEYGSVPLHLLYVEKVCALCGFVLVLVPLCLSYGVLLGQWTALM